MTSAGASAAGAGARCGAGVAVDPMAFDRQQHSEGIVEDASSISVQCRPAHAVVRRGYAYSPTMRS